jgi:ribosomal protein S18 acetylase RimI-like enzyme
MTFTKLFRDWNQYLRAVYASGPRMAFPSIFAIPHIASVVCSINWPDVSGMAFASRIFRQLMIQTAALSDIPFLLEIEQASFSSDAISRRSFHYLLSKGYALTLLDRDQTRVKAYITLLFRSDASHARIYSIATHPDFWGQGCAGQLVDAAERAAVRHKRHSIRLEIRKDNRASLKLFKHRNYEIFSEYANYYEDGMDAFRLEKKLI